MIFFRKNLKIVFQYFLVQRVLKAFRMIDLSQNSQVFVFHYIHLKDLWNLSKFAQYVKFQSTSERGLIVSNKFEFFKIDNLQYTAQVCGKNHCVHARLKAYIYLRTFANFQKTFACIMIRIHKPYLSLTWITVSKFSANMSRLWFLPSRFNFRWTIGEPYQKKNDLIRGPNFSLWQYSRVFDKHVNNRENSDMNNTCSRSHKETCSWIC